MYYLEYRSFQGLHRLELTLFRLWILRQHQIFQTSMHILTKTLNIAKPVCYPLYYVGSRTAKYFGYGPSSGKRKLTSYTDFKTDWFWALYYTIIARYLVQSVYITPRWLILHEATPRAISVFEVQYKLILHEVPCYNYYIIWPLDHCQLKGEKMHKN